MGVRARVAARVRAKVRANLTLTLIHPNRNRNRNPNLAALGDARSEVAALGRGGLVGAQLAQGQLREDAHARAVRLAERVANEFAGVLLWAKPVQPARSGDPSAGWRPAVLRLERVEPAGPTLTFAVEGAGFISQQKAAKHVAAASVAPLLDAALAAHRANDVATARQRARPLSILERLSQARGWPAPEPSGSDAVTWGPEGAVVRAPRCAKGGGDKLQLAALVALRSLDPDAVSTAITRPASGAPAPPPTGVCIATNCDSHIENAAAALTKAPWTASSYGFATLWVLDHFVKSTPSMRTQKLRQVAS